MTLESPLQGSSCLHLICRFPILIILGVLVGCWYYQPITLDQLPSFNNSSKFQVMECCSNVAMNNSSFNMTNCTCRPVIMNKTELMESKAAKVVQRL